ncbi:MAG: hypothetical protein WD826_12190 [Actinomycetota bacterium]
MVRVAKGTMYLRGVDQRLVREAKAFAAREGITLSALVERALERETSTDRPPSGRLSEIARDMAWYERELERLLERHAGRHLAIVDEEVVDEDTDLEALAARVSDRYGARSVFMPFCSSEPRVIDVRSPRRAG